MNFNIYLDEANGLKLAAEAKNTGETRNALIRKAVHEWLARQSTAQWPDEVLSFTGLAEMPPFEAGRDQLKPPAADPLA